MNFSEILPIKFDSLVFKFLIPCAVWTFLILTLISAQKEGFDARHSLNLSLRLKPSSRHSGKRNPSPKTYYLFFQITCLKCTTSSGKYTLFLRSKSLKNKQLDLQACKKPENWLFPTVFKTSQVYISWAFQAVFHVIFCW